MPTRSPLGSSVRLLASDLDGTLLGPDSQVSPRTADSLRAAAAAGVEIVAATGRSHWSAVSRLRPVGCVRWAICSNGATVYDLDADDVVVRRSLTDDQVSEVVDRAGRAFGTIGLAWESPTGVFHTDRWEAVRRAADSAFVAKSSRPTRELVVGREPVLKLMLAHDRLTQYEWLDALAAHVPNGVSVSTSGADFVEITSADANKGAALATLCAQLGVDQAETVAFGDHANDVAMLAWAGTGYAMANADQRVLAMADAVAPHHADDGVAQVLDQLLA